MPAAAGRRSRDGADAFRGGRTFAALRVIPEPGSAGWLDDAVNLLHASDGTNTVDAVVAAPQTERSIAAAGVAFDGYPSFVVCETGTPIRIVEWVWL